MDKGLLNNRYRLVELIGSGGMAMVYKGVDTLLHRPVAIKILREAYASDPTFLARFQQEARAAAQLDHPNVVTIYDVGQDEDRHYIVMEYVDGVDLKTLIRREAPLSVNRAVGIAEQIAAGVGHAHDADIIHCDVKPQNVLINKEGVAKVTDFGIARALSESGLTDSDTVWGSPLYFSPEQAAGERPKPASDVYSIGVVLYEMLTGIPPFQAEKPTALALMHIREEPRPLSSVNARVPPQLEWIARKVLAKEPSARYRNGEQMALVLKEYQTRGEEATGLHEIPPEATSRPDFYPNHSPPPSPSPPAETQEADWRTWALGALAVIAVVGLIPLWALVYRAWNRSSAPPGSPGFATATPTVNTVVVPDVQGQNWEDAQPTLEAAELRFELQEDTESDEPEGTIVGQEPAPGERVPVGSQVRLRIAGPPEVVEMPGVMDVPLEVASSWLEDAQLQVFLEPIWSTRPISTVIGQEPERGTEVEAGSLVTLTVSGGTDVPIQIDANLADRILLEEAELRRAQFSPGELMSVSLRWRPLTNIDTRYVVFIHLIGPDGNLIAQEDVEPLHGAQPTNTWSPDVPLWDLHQVRVPPDVPRGTYQLRTGMYPQDRPADRLPVVDPGQTTVESNSILVAEVEIGRP